MKYTHIIWDFNGTILNDVQACIESVNVLLKARGLAELASVEDYRAIQEFPVINYYVKLGFDFEHTVVRSLNGDNDEYVVTESDKLDMDELALTDCLLQLPSKMLCKEDCFLLVRRR